jgi:hypothetical protein
MVGESKQPVACDLQRKKGLSLLAALGERADDVSR